VHGVVGTCTLQDPAAQPDAGRFSTETIVETIALGAWNDELAEGRAASSAALRRWLALPRLCRRAGNKLEPIRFAAARRAETVSFRLSSGLVAVKQANDRIEATLPDPEIDYRSRSGP